MFTLGILAPLLATLPLAKGLVRPDGVGRVPALGWNSWNAFGCNINETDFLNAANQIVSLGLQDAGYSYVNVDDCWSVKSGRGSNGQIVPDPTKFPDGISGTADKIHGMGLKMGIYSSAGTETCAGYPASLGYEDIDAATFAAWGIDYLKYDNCNVPSNWTDTCNACVPDSSDGGPFPNGTCAGLSGNYCPAGYDYSQSNTAKRYMIMRDALEAQNRTILYSLCEWGQADVQTWGNETANSWRATGDITPNWSRILEILNENSFYMNYVNFWGHSDPDMLEVGNGDLTAEETRSHFALWAAMKSPLLIGTDLTTISSDNVAILKNQYLLAFNQDGQYGAPAAPYKWGVNPDWTFNASYPAQYWSGQFQQGTLVLILNLNSSTTQMIADWGEIPGLISGAAYQVTEAWSGTSMGCLTGGLDIQVPAHDTAVLVVGSSCTPTKKRGRNVIALPFDGAA